jgi:hypothetical protein
MSAFNFMARCYNFLCRHPLATKNLKSARKVELSTHLSHLSIAVREVFTSIALTSSCTVVKRRKNVGNLHVMLFVITRSVFLKK